MGYKPHAYAYEISLVYNCTFLKMNILTKTFYFRKHIPSLPTFNCLAHALDPSPIGCFKASPTPNILKN